MAYATKATLKERLERSDTDDDDLFDDLLDGATSLVNEAVGRTLEEDQYKEYRSGDGSPMLWLRQGPIVNLITLKYVTYDDNGNESYTDLLEAVDFIVEGVREDPDSTLTGWKLPSRLRHDSFWLTGARNYQIVYTAGYESGAIPGDLEEACLYAAAWLYNRRKDAATESRDIGLGSMSFRDQAELYDDLRRMLRSYRTARAA